MTPSAISHRINKLEEELGIALFTRSHRKITLTEEGERIYLALNRTLNELNQEVMEVRNGEVSGELTIYSRPSFAQCWLVPRLYLFKQKHPSIELNILTGNENVNFQGYGIDARSISMSKCQKSCGRKIDERRDNPGLHSNICRTI